MEKLFEKLGIFYLGRDYDQDLVEPTQTPTLIKSKNFTTHAAIIGMTGSGKTGLGIDILEEAAIDNIPIIAIDPKGDIGNLSLSFENLEPKDFEPWVSEEAQNRGVPTEELAAKTAKMWREGIESFDQSTDRIKTLKEHDVTIYTPGSSAGIPVNVLGSLDIPDESILNDADTFASAINSTVASLLSLLGIEADALESREFILLAQIIKRSWMSGSALDMGTLIAQIITPPFSKIGVLPLESFYPPAERFKLASRFNNVLASPTFENWLKGSPLDIDSMMFDKKGKSKISIFSIAHLSDQERMFFVTLLLNRILGWMRSQSGTGRLRAIVYMDEIYGYFPPSKNPPSKEPMMLMLKQARAFGIGMVLSTQNPVDLDYKGLSNIGTWFIGRLQTRQDIAKVAEGLSSQMGTSLPKKRIEQLLSALPKRVFFLKSAHMEGVRLFGTRWVLSYLKGPLKKREIAALMERKKGESVSRPAAESRKRAAEKSTYAGGAPILPSAIECRYDTPLTKGGRYLPTLSAKCSVRFFNASRGIDIKEERCFVLELSESDDRVEWDRAKECMEDFEKSAKTPANDRSFAPLPDIIGSAKSLTPFKKSLSEYLYAERRLELYRCRPLKLESEPKESMESFKARIMEELEERKSLESEKIERMFEKRFQTLQSRRQRAMQRVEKERQDMQQKSTDSLIDTGLAIFGAIFGSKRGAVSKAGRAIKSGKGILKERADLKRAEEQLLLVEEKIEDLKSELEERLERLDEKYAVENFEIESFFIKPRKSDIKVETMALYWICDE